MCQELMQNIIQSSTQGAVVMAVGMGIVFSFLTILVFAIMIMARCVAFIEKIWPSPTEEVKTTKKTKTSDDTEIAIAIAVAKSAV
jgi:sodium pump decarboxylase gamma subunit